MTTLDESCAESVRNECFDNAHMQVGILSDYLNAIMERAVFEPARFMGGRKPDGSIRTDYVDGFRASIPKDVFPAAGYGSLGETTEEALRNLRMDIELAVFESLVRRDWMPRIGVYSLTWRMRDIIKWGRNTETGKGYREWGQGWKR